eukprot:3933195-Rhodomonas_salina.2
MGNSILDTAQRWTEQPYEIAKVRVPVGSAKSHCSPGSIAASLGLTPIDGIASQKAKAQKGLGEVVPVDPDRETLVQVHPLRPDDTDAKHKCYALGSEVMMGSRGQELAKASRSKVRTVFEIAGAPAPPQLRLSTHVRNGFCCWKLQR